MTLLFTDGASRGNPGNASCAFALVQDENILFSSSIFLGTATNNVAEYCAIQYGLVAILPSNIKDIEVMSDSELVINQLNGSYKCNSPPLNFYRIIITELTKKFNSVTFKYVPRTHKYIQVCDSLCNKELDKYK